MLESLLDEDLIEGVLVALDYTMTTRQTNENMPYVTLRSGFCMFDRKQNAKTLINVLRLVAKLQRRTRRHSSRMLSRTHLNVLCNVLLAQCCADFSLVPLQRIPF